MKYDYELTVRELAKKYPEGHPGFTIEEWKTPVVLQDYWTWLHERLRAAEETFNHDFSWE